MSYRTDRRDIWYQGLLMRVLAALLLILTTIGWALFAWAALFPTVALLGNYTLQDGISVTIIYLIAPLALAVAWSLLLQRRLLAGNQMKTASAIATFAAVFI